MKRMSTGGWFAIAIAIAVAITVAVSSGQSKAEPVAYPTAATARFSVDVVGKGPDIILVPGLGSSRETYDATVEKLKDQYRLHVLQVAGFAGEPAGANAEGPMLPPTVEAIHDYIKAKNLKNPIYIGHSLGGLMGLMLAKAHPDDLGKLVIVDALPFYGVLFSPSATVAMVAPQAGIIRDQIIATPEAAFEAQQKATVAGLVVSEADQARIVTWSMTSDRKVFAKAFYEDLTTDVRGDISAITTPTLMLYPWKSGGMFSVEAVDQLYTRQYKPMPKVTMIRIDDARHFLMLDQPAAYMSALEAFLRP